MLASLFNRKDAPARVQAMSVHISPTLPNRRVVFRASVALTVLVALAACSHRSAEDPRHLNYDQRHPLTLQQSAAQLPLLVGENATELTSGDRVALAGFVQTHQREGESALRVSVPTGTANAAAARDVLADIHDVVAGAGGDPSQVIVERYELSQPGAHAPIVVKYDRLTASTNQCGTWADTMNPALSHPDFYNFGCSTQANFGAMLEDPRDLVRPRGVGYPDAGRRAEVLARYRRGEESASPRSDDGQAGVAEIELQ